MSFGRLANGLRWAVIPNSKPQGRLAIRLCVQAGALMEEPHELGAAHFLEHMAFRGSRNFPAGSLIPFFQKHGMSLGDDTNAQTSMTETVYKLSLADASDRTLAEGLGILRDIADGLLLDPAQIEEERGVILAEKRARNTEDLEITRAWKRFIFGESRYGRELIGSEETVSLADSASLRAFYEKWYVPGRMVIVLAGEADPWRVSMLVEEIFGSMPASALPAVESIGEFDTAPGVRVLVQKRPVTNTSVSIAQFHPKYPVGDTETRQRVQFVNWLGRIAVSRRLSALREKDPTLWVGAGFHDGRLALLAPMVQLMANTRGDGWRRALEALETERRRAITHGLTLSEVETILAEIDSSLERVVGQRSASTNEELADGFISALDRALVYTSPVQDLERWRRIRDTITVEEASQAVREAFSPDSFRIRISGATTATEREVLDAWREFQRRTVAAPEDTCQALFPYLGEPPEAPAPVLTATTVGAPSLGIVRHEAVLGNGLRLVLVPLPFEKGTVSATLVFGDGLLGVPDEETPVARTALMVLGNQGVGRLTRLENTKRFGARGLMTGETASTRWSEIVGVAQRDDAVLLLEAMRTRFLDPVLTDTNRLKMIEGLSESAFKRNDTVPGVVRSRRMHWFAGEPVRVKPLEPGEAAAVPLEAMRRYLADLRTRGDRTLLVTGDFDLPTVAKEAARRFGSLAAPKAPRSLLGVMPRFPAELEKEVVVENDHLGKAVVMLAWRLDLTDPADRRTRVARNLLTAVAGERLRRRIREELGVSYSPDCLSAEFPEMDGFGLIFMQAETDTASLSRVRASMEAIARDLRDKGVTEQELELQKEPMLTAWRTNLSSNRWWTGILLSELTLGLPWSEWVCTTDEMISSVTAGEVNREAAAVFSTACAAFTVRSGSSDATVSIERPGRS
ncbi:pitrilysin family protein [Sutterella sp.]|uniref:M16 family metallopeptidase n=1 Tax=Sutterella sp. TaxID=1981025 RepID=UPI0026E08DF8|nr:M16 family metallopeptidase [Sutterella sp.]MDO5532944.1 insulinase family protein [Sutterella sp.]